MEAWFVIMQLRSVSRDRKVLKAKGNYCLCKLNRQLVLGLSLSKKLLTQTHFDNQHVSELGEMLKFKMYAIKSVGAGIGQSV
jgi:hypothetical protein